MYQTKSLTFQPYVKRIPAAKVHCTRFFSIVETQLTAANEGIDDDDEDLQAVLGKLNDEQKMHVFSYLGKICKAEGTKAVDDDDDEVEEEEEVQYKSDDTRSKWLANTLFRCDNDATQQRTKTLSSMFGVRGRRGCGGYGRR